LICSFFALELTTYPCASQPTALSSCLVLPCLVLSFLACLLLSSLAFSSLAFSCLLLSCLLSCLWPLASGLLSCLVLSLVVFFLSCPVLSCLVSSRLGLVSPRPVLSSLALALFIVLGLVLAQVQSPRDDVIVSGRGLAANVVVVCLPGTRRSKRHQRGVRLRLVVS
jgi:hypothetical protein